MEARNAWSTSEREIYQEKDMRFKFSVWSKYYHTSLSLRCPWSLDIYVTLKERKQYQLNSDTMLFYHWKLFFFLHMDKGLWDLFSHRVSLYITQSHGVSLYITMHFGYYNNFWLQCQIILKVFWRHCKWQLNAYNSVKVTAIWIVMTRFLPPHYSCNLDTNNYKIHLDFRDVKMGGGGGD